MPYGHASGLLFGDGSEATEPYNKIANLFKYIKFHAYLLQQHYKPGIRRFHRKKWPISLHASRKIMANFTLNFTGYIEIHA